MKVSVSATKRSTSVPSHAELLQISDAFARLSDSFGGEEDLPKQVLDRVREIFEKAPQRHSFVIELVGSSVSGTAVDSSDVDISVVWLLPFDEKSADPWDYTSKCFRICDWAIETGLLQEGSHGSYCIPGLDTKVDIVAGLRPEGEVSWDNSVRMLPCSFAETRGNDFDIDVLGDYEVILNIGLNSLKAQVVRQLPISILQSVKLLKVWSRRLPKREHGNRPSGYALSILAVGVAHLQNLFHADPFSICTAVWQLLSTIPEPMSGKVLELQVSRALNSAEAKTTIADSEGDNGLRLIEPFAEFRHPVRRNLCFNLDSTTLKLEADRAVKLCETMQSCKGELPPGLLSQLFIG